MSDSEGVFEGGENIGVSEEFRNAIINVKKSLNDNIIRGPELETRQAQDLNILNDYIKSLNNYSKFDLDLLYFKNAKIETNRRTMIISGRFFFILRLAFESD